MSPNDHRILIRDGIATGTGHFGSGQTFAVRMNASLPNMDIGPLNFDRASKVQSQNASQLESITPDFSGLLGYHFWAVYAFKLDYDGSRVTFYKGEISNYLDKEKVVAELPFTTRKLPNHPIVQAKIGNLDAVAAFDTGQYGTLFTTARQKADWVRAGILKPSTARPDA